MAGKPTRMSKIKQLLRLHQQGVSNRGIGRELGLYKATVNSYIDKLKLHGYDIDQLLELEDPVLEAKFMAGTAAYTQDKFTVFREQIPYFEKELGRAHVTRKLLWDEYKLNHAGRLLKTTHQLTDGTTVKPQVTLAENSYDDLGRLKTNKKGGVAGTLATYAYNVRSWTKSITGSLFTENLYYNESYGGNVPRYNGNITAMNWTIQGETVPRGYAFAYDNLSRLTGANYLLNGSVPATNDYKVENIVYDKHGNIKNLKRYGKTSSGATYALVDNLTMTYSGNQLVHVADAITNPTYAESADFKDKVSATGTIEYTYTANGAMNKDLNKGISDIQYNSLNLPQVMIINSPTAKAKNYYTYSASGVKLRTEQRYDPNYTVTPSNATNPANDGLADYMNRDYVGNIVYETAKNGSAITNSTRILVDGGYYEGGVYYYYLTDHLGNNRVVVNQSGIVTQKNHYYPFGTAFADKYDNGTNQPYKYNGKELDGMHQLNLYDYSARYYESAVGRFTRVDPHAENYYSWSPYHYAANNPLLITDPTGMDWYRNEDGTAYIWREGSAQTYTHTIGEGDNAISMTMSRVGETYVQMLSDGTKMVWNQQNLESMTEPQSFEQGTMSKMEKWSSSDNFFANLSYNAVNDFYVTGQGLVHLLSLGTVGRSRVNELTGEKEYANLDGTTNYKSEQNLINTAATLFSGNASKIGTGALPKGLGYVNKLGASQFSHTFKGTLSTFSPATRGVLNRGLNQGINSYNNQISNGMVLLKAKGLAPK